MERTKKETSRNKVALITEGDAHLMIEDDMRRWTATISHSHAVTNNPQLEPYDSGNPRSYIAYLDAKNRNRLRQEIFVSFANTKFPTLM